MHSPACSVAARSTSHEVIKDVISTVTTAAATNHHHHNHHHNNGNNSGTSTPKNSNLGGNVQSNNTNNSVSGGSNKSTPRTSPALTSSNNNGINNNNTGLLNQSVPGISFVLPTPTNSNNNNNNISSPLSVSGAAEYNNNSNSEVNSPSSNVENNLLPPLSSSSPQNIIIYGNSSSAQYNQTFEQLPSNLAKFANKKNIFTLDARYPMNQQAIQQHFQNQNNSNNNTNTNNNNNITSTVANNNTNTINSNNRKFSSFYYQQQQQQQPQPHPYYTNKNFSSFTNSQLRACDCVLVRNGHFLSEEAWASLYDELMKVEKAHQQQQDIPSPNKKNNKNQNDDEESKKVITSTKIDSMKNPNSEAITPQSSAEPKSMQIPHHRPPVVIALCDDAFYDNNEDAEDADRKITANRNSNSNHHFMSQHNNNHHYSFLSRYSKDPSLCYQIRISGSGVMTNSTNNDDVKSEDVGIQQQQQQQQQQNEVERTNTLPSNNNNSTKSSNMMSMSKPVTNSSFSGAMGWMSMMASSSSSSFGGNNNNNNLLIAANQLASPGLPYHAGMVKNNNINNNAVVALWPEGTSSTSFASSSSSSFTFAPNNNNPLLLSVPPTTTTTTTAINHLIQTPTSTFTEDGTSTNFLNPFASENQVESKKTPNGVVLPSDHELDAVDDTRALLLTSSLLHNFHDLITKTDNGEITSNKEILLVRDSMLKIIESNSSVPSTTVFLPSSGTVTKVTQHFLQQLRLQHDKDNNSKRKMKNDDNKTNADDEATKNNNNSNHLKPTSSFVPISYFSVPERNDDTIKPLAKIYMSSGGDIHNNNNGSSSDSKKSSNNSNNPFVPKSSLVNVANSIPMQQTVCNEMPVFVLAGSLLIPLQTQQQQDYSEVTLTTTVPHYTKVVGFYSLKGEMENTNDNDTNNNHHHHQLTRQRLIDLLLLKNFQKKSHNNNNTNNNNNVSLTAVKAKSSLPAENPEDLAKELEEYDRHFAGMDDLDLMMNDDKDHDAKLHMVSEFLNRCYNSLPVVEIMQDKFILVPSMSSWKSSLPRPPAANAATTLNGSTSASGMMSMNRSSNNSGSRSPAMFLGTPSNNTNSIMNMFKNSAIVSSNQPSLLSTPSNSVPATPSVGMNDGSLLFPPPAAAAADSVAQNDSPSSDSFVENNEHPNNINAGATPPGLPFIPGYKAGMMMMAKNGTPTQSASSTSLPQQHDSRRHSHLDQKEDLVSVCFLPLFPAVAVSAGFRNGSEKEILALRMAVRDLFLKRQQQQNEMKAISNDKQNHHHHHHQHVSFSENVSVIINNNNNNYFSAWWSSQDPCDVYRALMNLREAVYSFEGSGEIVVLPTNTNNANDAPDQTAISSPTTASSVNTQSTSSISSSSASLSKKQHTTITKQECQAVFFTAVTALLHSLVADLVTVNTNARNATRKHHHHHHTNQQLPTKQTVVETWLRSFVTSRCKNLPSSILTASTASSNNTNSSQSTFSPTQTIRSTRDLYTNNNDDDNLSLQAEDTDSKAMNNHNNMSMNQERQQILHDEFFQDVYDAKNQETNSNMMQSKPRSVIIVEDHEYHQISKNKNTKQQEASGSPRSVKRTIPKRSSIINNNNESETTATPKNVRFMLPREHFERRKQIQLEQQQQQQQKKNKDNKGNADNNNNNLNNSFSLRRVPLTPTSSTTMSSLLGTVVDRIGGPLVAAVGVTAGFALGATLFQRFAVGNTGSSSTVNSISNFFRK